MQYINRSGQLHNDPSIVFSEQPESPEMEVFPLTNIPVECEDARVHDGVSPCGDPTCYCAHYGYGVPSLE